MRSDTLSLFIIPEVCLERAKPRWRRLAVRKDLVAGILLMLAGLSTAVLQAFQIIALSFGISFVGFCLTLAGGILFLIRSGEVA